MKRIKLQAGQEVQDIKGNIYKIEEGDCITFKESTEFIDEVEVLKPFTHRDAIGVTVELLPGMYDIYMGDYVTLRPQSGKDKYSGWVNLSPLDANSILNRWEKQGYIK